MSYLNNTTTYENYTIENICNIPQEFYTFAEYYECYKYFFSIKFSEAVLGICIFTFTIIFNGLVIYLIATKPTEQSLYDKIIIGHSIVNGLTGIVDIPFFHVEKIFGYWPFWKGLSLFWASYDNNINTTTSMHMLYMSYVRLRSLRAPKGYTSEFLIKYPWCIMISFWIMGLGAWTPITLYFSTADHSTAVDIEPRYVFALLNVISWFLPLFATGFLSLIVLKILIERENKKVHSKRKMILSVINSNKTAIHTSEFSHDEGSITNETSNKKNESILKKIEKFFRFSSVAKFSCIIFSYWLQWILPCVFTVISPCNCISEDAYNAVYWLTYTVCFTDPLVVLILNPNVGRSKKKIV